MGDDADRETRNLLGHEAATRSDEFLSEEQIAQAESNAWTKSRERRPDPPGSSARARLESVTRVRGLVETAHNYMARTPEPPAPERFKEAALDAFTALEAILARWQGYEQDKLA